MCGCCTVWVDGLSRLACVTPVTRVLGRHVTTLEGSGWRCDGGGFAMNCASQCDANSGIIMRLAAMDLALTRRTRHSSSSPEVSPRPLHRGLTLMPCAIWPTTLRLTCRCGHHREGAGTPGLKGPGSFQALGAEVALECGLRLIPHRRMRSYAVPPEDVDHRDRLSGPGGDRQPGALRWKCSRAT